MVTMLDVIKRSKEKMNLIIDSRESIFDEVINYVKGKDIDEIFFVGSGSSYSSALSTMLVVEKLSGIKTHVMLPNLFINKEIYNPNALYVLVSQTGTSSLMIKLASKLKKLNVNVVVISSDANSPLVKECEHFIELCIGYEEYTYATLGFTCSMLTEILLGLELGFIKNYLTLEKYNEYIDELKKTPDSNYETIIKTIEWFDLKKDKLLSTENFVLYGNASLYGIANEGALKIMEITKKYVSVGYEMDDGMHGPNYCLDERTAVIALNDGKDDKNAHDLMNLMKKEYASGYLVGVNPIDDDDLKLNIRTSNFTNLEIVSFVQTLAYLLAREIKVDIFEKKDPRINTTKGKGYFNMHEVKM